jgi:hypothetical protein
MGFMGDVHSLGVRQIGALWSAFPRTELGPRNNLPNHVSWQGLYRLKWFRYIRAILRNRG